MSTQREKAIENYTAIVENELRLGDVVQARGLYYVVNRVLSRHRFVLKLVSAWDYTSNKKEEKKDETVPKVEAGGSAV